MPKKRRFKRTTQSAQITIPKRNPPTLSPFISTNFKLKQPKKYPLPFTPPHHNPHHQFHTLHHLHHENLTQHENINHSCTVHLQRSYTQYSPNPHHSYAQNSYHYHQDHYSHPFHQHQPPITTINATITTTTTTATQTQMPSLMELDISLPPRLCTPSMLLTIPLSSFSPPMNVAGTSAIRTLGDSPTKPAAVNQGNHRHLAILKKFITKNKKENEK